MYERHLYLFGTPRLEYDGISEPLHTKGQPRWIALLAYLALERRKLDRRILGRLIWQYEDNSRDRLRRHTLEELKGKIGSQWLFITPSSVQLDTEHLWVDVNFFVDTLDKFALDASRDDRHTVAFLEEALLSYEGDFLGDYNFPEIGQFSDWLEEKREFLRGKFVGAVKYLIATFYNRDNLAKAEQFAILWTKYKWSDIQGHAWLLNIYEQQGRSEAIVRHMRSIEPYFLARGITKTDLLHARDYVKENPLESIFPAPVPSTSSLSEIAQPNEKKGNPPFYQSYVDLLYEIAARNPLEAVKFAGNISAMLFDLMDNPRETDEILDRVENMILGSDKGKNPRIIFNLRMQRLRIFRALAMTEKIMQLIAQVSEDDIELMGLDRETRAEWYHNLGVIYCWIQGDYQKALDAFHKASAEIILTGDIGWDAAVIADMGLVYWNQGNLKLAEDNLALGKQLFLQISGHDRQVIMCIGNLGLVYLFQGKLEEALKSIQHQLNLAIDLRYIKEIRRSTGNRGVIKFHLGQYDEAITDLASEMYQTMPQNEGFLYAQINLSRCYRAKNNFDLAYKLALEALNLAEEKNYASIKVVAKRALAECVSSEQAIPLLQTALEEAKNLHRYFDEAACLMSLSEYLANTPVGGQFRKDGEAILRKIGAELWLQRRPSRLELPIL